ncbi:MAG: hypothetical protein QOH93_1603 [Chloroflexia bacterium]|nr:hypothetical protein [Chloroflexia bacterium]
MKAKVLIGSSMAVGLLGLGMLVGSVAGTGRVSAQTPAATATAATAVPSAPKQAPEAQATPVTAITQQQAEAAALAAAPGSTVDHTRLGSENGVAAWDVDFTNGGGVIINADTGAVITVEAAGNDSHGGRGPGGRGENQAALVAQAKITQQQAEAAALAAAPGSTVDHTRIGNESGTLTWDVDFADGGGAQVNADTGAVITVEAAGTDNHGGHRPGGPSKTQP